MGKKQRDQPSGRLIAAQFRMNSEARGLLKAQAALKGMTMEDLLHQVLCTALDRPDLLDRPPSSFLRKSAPA